MIQKWIKKLGDSDQRVRVYAASVLSSVIDTPEARQALVKEIPALIKALDNPDKEVRLNALVTMSEMGVHAKEAVPALIEALNDRDKDVCTYAARTLKNIGKPASQAVAALVKILNDEASALRVNVIGVLGQIGDSAAVPALVTALGDADEGVRMNAGDALYKIGNTTAISA